MLFKFNNIPDLCIDICIIYYSISITKQQSIPVGCIPPAAVAINWRGLPQCMLGYTPGCGPGDPPGVGLETPLCGPGDPPWPDHSSTTLGLVLETCKACWDTHPPPGDLQGMLGYHLQGMLGYPPLNKITDACKNITFPQLRLLAVKHVNNV